MAHVRTYIYRYRTSKILLSPQKLPWPLGHVRLICFLGLVCAALLLCFSSLPTVSLLIPALRGLSQKCRAPLRAETLLLSGTLRAWRSVPLWTATITSMATRACAPDLLLRSSLRCFAFLLYLLVF